MCHENRCRVRVAPGARVRRFSGLAPKRCANAWLLGRAQVVNTWSEAELGRIIRDYGEEKLWRQVARRITAARAKGPIRTTMQLVEAIGHTQVPSKGGGGGKRIHPATRTFQVRQVPGVAALACALASRVRLCTPLCGLLSTERAEHSSVALAATRAWGTQALRIAVNDEISKLEEVSRQQCALLTAATVRADERAAHVVMRTAPP